MEDTGIDDDTTCDYDSKDGKGMREKLLNFTKTMIISGLMIWSAPLVGPPLVVCSLIGVVFFMPFSFLYASSTFAENLMGKFLPLSLKQSSGGLLDQEDGELVHGEEFVKLIDNPDEGEASESVIADDDSTLETEILKRSDAEHTDDMGSYGLSDMDDSTTVHHAVKGEDSDAVELPVLVGVRENGHAGVEPAISEEKIKEQLAALCKIIGYVSEPHATCAEDLRGLYMCTGIEPHACLDNCGIEELNCKLRSLMSVIGVQ